MEDEAGSNFLSGILRIENVALEIDFFLIIQICSLLLGSMTSALLAAFSYLTLNNNNELCFC